MNQENKSDGKEQIMEVLQQKMKENKVLQMKLAKVEEKYVSVFKENRSLAKDRDTFIEFVKRRTDNYNQKQVGELDIECLQQILGEDNVTKFEGIQQQVQELERQLGQKEIELAQKEEKVDQIRQNCKQMIEDVQYNQKVQIQQEYEQKLDQLRETVQDLEDELRRVRNIVRSKDSEIERLTNLQKQEAIRKAEGLMIQIDKNREEEKEEERKKEQSEKNNQILVIQHQLDQLYQENVCLKKSFAEQLQKNEQLMVQVEFFNEQKNKIQNSGLQGPQSIEVVDLNHFESESEKAKQRGLMDDKNGQDMNQEINQQYLKNIVIKYIVYYEGGYEKECKILFRAIGNILKFDESDFKIIEESRKNSWFYKYVFNNFGCIKPI